MLNQNQSKLITLSALAVIIGMSAPANATPAKERFFTAKSEYNSDLNNIIYRQRAEHRDSSWFQMSVKSNTQTHKFAPKYPILDMNFIGESAMIGSSIWKQGQYEMGFALAINREDSKFKNIHKYTTFPSWWTTTTVISDVTSQHSAFQTLSLYGSHQLKSQNQYIAMVMSFAHGSLRQANGWAPIMSSDLDYLKDGSTLSFNNEIAYGYHFPQHANIEMYLDTAVNSNDLDYIYKGNTVEVSHTFQQNIGLRAYYSPALFLYRKEAKLGWSPFISGFIDTAISGKEFKIKSSIKEIKAPAIASNQFGLTIGVRADLAIRNLPGKLLFTYNISKQQETTSNFYCGYDFII